MDTIINLSVSNTALAVVLAVGVLALARLWRNPHVAHALWLLVLLKLITPPLLPVTIPWHHVATPAVAVGDMSTPRSSAGSTAARRAADEGQGASSQHVGERLSAFRAAGGTGSSTPSMRVRRSDARTLEGRGTRRNLVLSCAALLWTSGIILCMGIFLWRCRNFHRLLKTAEEATGELAGAVQRLADRLELRRCPRVRVTAARIPPLVWSLTGRPLVVLPRPLLADLEPAQRDAVIAHELAHVKRRDHLVRWLEVLVLVPFWWNPIAWFARRKLREAEEECCDAWVVWAMPGQRRSYGQAMLKTIEFLTDSPGVPALAGSTLGSSFYKRRIEMILKRDVNHRMSWVSFALVLLLAAAVLPLAAQTADSPDDPFGRSEADASASADRDQPSAVDVPVLDIDVVAELDQASRDEPAVGADFVATRDDLIQRIEKLERALAALSDTHGAIDAGSEKDRDPLADRFGPPGERFAADDAELDLKAELLRLDVEEAEAALESAVRALKQIERSEFESPSDMERLRGEVRLKEIALKRAMLKMQMFQREAQARREAVKRRVGLKERERTLTQRAKQDLALRDAAAQKVLAQKMEQYFAARQQREMAEQIAAQQKHLAKELERIEKMAKESPASEQTMQQLESFLKGVLKMSEEEVKAALERMKSDE